MKDIEHERCKREEKNSNKKKKKKICVYKRRKVTVETKTEKKKGKRILFRSVTRRLSISLKVRQVI